LLDGGGEDTFNADAVGAHDGRDFFAGGVENAGAHGLGVFVAELEDVADFDGFSDAERAAVDGVRLVFLNVADVFGGGCGDVAGDRNVAEVEVELVGTGDHVFAADEGGVEDDGGGVGVEELCLLGCIQAAGAIKSLGGGEGSGGVEAMIVLGGPGGEDGEADGTEEAGGGVEVLSELLGDHGTEGVRGGGCLELGFVDLVVAAEECDDGFLACVIGEGALAHEGDALDVVDRGDVKEGADVGDGAHAGGGDELGGAVAGWREVFDRGEAGGGAFQIGGVAGGGGGDEIFAGLGVDHELLRLRAAHGTGVGFDGKEVETAAGEDAAVDGVVFRVGLVEAGGIEVEGIGVFHEELADAEEAGFGAGLVAELGLDLVPDLGELLVGAELVTGDGGHGLFVGHAEAEIGALAVCKPKHVLAHRRPAAGLFPKLAGHESGKKELLADGVHFFADDGHNFVDGPIAEEEIGVEASTELADVAAAQKEFVAGDFGVGGELAEGGDEELGPAMHAWGEAFLAALRAGVIVRARVRP